MILLSTCEFDQWNIINQFAFDKTGKFNMLIDNDIAILNQYGIRLFVVDSNTNELLYEFDVEDEDSIDESFALVFDDDKHETFFRLSYM